MKVVILAGGFGTRLSEETRNIPKPMVEIGDKPILWHIMKIYSHYGFNDFVICLGYKSMEIKKLVYELIFCKTTMLPSMCVKIGWKYTIIKQNHGK